MNRSDYFYKTLYIQGKPAILIVDRNLGNKSVTNDIENVLADLEAVTVLPLPEYEIIYRDSEGAWDLVTVTDSGNFMGFEPGDPLTDYQKLFDSPEGSEHRLATHDAVPNGPS